MNIWGSISLINSKICFFYCKAMLVQVHSPGCLLLHLWIMSFKEGWIGLGDFDKAALDLSRKWIYWAMLLHIDGQFCAVPGLLWTCRRDVAIKAVFNEYGNGRLHSVCQMAPSYSNMFCYRYICLLNGEIRGTGGWNAVPCISALSLHLLVWLNVAEGTWKSLHSRCSPFQ